jgi:hypothetical protein
MQKTVQRLCDAGSILLEEQEKAIDEAIKKFFKGESVVSSIDGS